MKIKEKVKEKVTTKLMEEKEWYRLVLSTEGVWNTTLRIPTFDRISLKDKEILGGHIFKLYLSREEVLTFKTVYKNYIIAFSKIEEEKSDAKAVVWK